MEQDAGGQLVSQLSLQLTLQIPATFATLILCFCMLNAYHKITCRLTACSRVCWVVFRKVEVVGSNMQSKNGLAATEAVGLMPGASAISLLVQHLLKNLDLLNGLPGHNLTQVISRPWPLLKSVRASSICKAPQRHLQKGRSAKNKQLLMALLL